MVCLVIASHQCSRRTIAPKIQEITYSGYSPCCSWRIADMGVPVRFKWGMYCVGSIFPGTTASMTT